MSKQVAMPQTRAVGAGLRRPFRADGRLLDGRAPERDLRHQRGRSRAAVPGRSVRACAGEPVGPRPAVRPTGAARPVDPVGRAGAPMRLTERGRMLVAAVFLAVAGFGLVATVGAAVGSWLSESSVRTEVVTVQPGQSIWSIARQADPAANPVDTVARIAQWNGLHSTRDVAPGVHLVVPAR